MVDGHYSYTLCSMPFALLPQCKEEKFKSIGHGWDHRFERPTIVGSTLVHHEKVIHMAFFKIGKSEMVGRMSPASRRGRYRV